MVAVRSLVTSATGPEQPEAISQLASAGPHVVDLWWFESDSRSSTRSMAHRAELGHFLDA